MSEGRRGEHRSFQLLQKLWCLSREDGHGVGSHHRVHVLEVVGVVQSGGDELDQVSVQALGCQGGAEEGYGQADALSVRKAAETAQREQEVFVDAYVPRVEALGVAAAGRRGRGGG